MAMLGKEERRVLLDPLFNNNPIALQVLGICSALAVTTQMAPSLIMCIALTAVTAGSSRAARHDGYRVAKNDRPNPISTTETTSDGSTTAGNCDRK